MAATESSNPFGYLLPVRPDAFVGRWPLVADVARRVLSQPGDSHAIIGGRRFGKTSLLAVLEHELSHGNGQARDHSALVVRISFDELRVASASQFFSIVLERARETSGATAPLDHRRLDEHAERMRSDGTLDDFQHAVDHIFDRLAHVQGPTRLVLLLDEMDEVLGFDCCGDLLGQLRNCISQSRIVDRMRVVAAGSRRFLDEGIRQGGSPFVNVLRTHYLRSLAQPDVHALTARCGDLPADVRLEVWNQCGGHPFLAQYLLFHLWELGCANATAGSVSRLVARFLHEEAFHLNGWVNALGPGGLRAYDYFADRHDWVDEMEVLKTLGDVKADLVALCYHGFLAMDDHWSRYRSEGELLRRWYRDSGRELMKAGAGFGARSRRPMQRIPRGRQSGDGQEVVVSSDERRIRVEGNYVEGDYVSVGGDMIASVAGRGGSVGQPAPMTSTADVEAALQKLLADVSMADLPPQDKAQVLPALVWLHGSVGHDERPADADIPQSTLRSCTAWIRDRLRSIASGAVGPIVDHWVIAFLRGIL